jgi:hypothetical protein
MTASGPACAEPEKAGVIDATNENTAADRRVLNLRVTAQAQIGIAHGQHFGIYRAVRLMTTGASFTQGGMFKDERFGLLAMTGGAVFVLPRHGQSAGGLHDVCPVWIVTIHAIHFAIEYGMMMRKPELGASGLMTLQASLGISPRIDDEFFEAAAAGGGDVFAAGTVTGFTTALTRHLRGRQVQSRVRTAGENCINLRMTIGTGLIADVTGSFNLQRHDYVAIHRRAGIE